ncbi:MAG TPA: Ig-like domain-containing protein, partial [Herpetosiphonaceae bacterium]|nr:Ig-like domain-containing protein [Herpetosiphonaceae bacterium]
MRTHIHTGLFKPRSRYHRLLSFVIIIAILLTSNAPVAAARTGRASTADAAQSAKPGAQNPAAETEHEAASAPPAESDRERAPGPAATEPARQPVKLISCAVAQAEHQVFMPFFNAGTGNQAANHAPIAKPCKASVPRNTTIAIDLLGVTGDADGDELKHILKTPPRSGTAQITTHVLVYTPTLNYTGPDFLAYGVSDGRGGSAQGSIDITVLELANHPPTALDIVAPTRFTEPVTIDLSLHASDQDGDPLQFGIHAAPISGT